MKSVVAPLVVGAGAVAAAVVLAVRDPRESTYVTCPFHALTGLWCPGCGGIRAMGDLVHGDVSAALSSNVVAVLALVVAILGWSLWMWARVRGRDIRLRRPGRGIVVTTAAAILVFTVVRNTPWGTWLAPV